VINMVPSMVEQDGRRILELGRHIYPMPVAIACGRVLRSRNASGGVDACLKAAEVLTRYISAVALASYNSIDKTLVIQPLAQLEGNLAFGVFLSVIQQVARLSSDHPVAQLLAQGFKYKKRGRQNVTGPTDSALVALLELRNELGHDLRNLDEARALSIVRDRSPVDILVAALTGSGEILKLPLFVIEDQQYSRECINGSRLMLMGESADPIPERIQIQSVPGGFASTHTPYIAVGDLAISLPPSVLWDIDQQSQRYSIFFIDGIQPHSLRYKTIEGNDHPSPPHAVSEFISLVSGESRQEPDKITLLNGFSLSREWRERRQHIEESTLRQEGRIDWTSYDAETIKWFALLIKSSVDDPSDAIKDILLEGRDTFEEHEIRQLNLLFGNSKLVRSEVRRDIADLRFIDEATGRPTRRELIETDNLLITLKKAVGFLARELDLDGLEAEGLATTEGTFDYIALREVLVNQIVHQDYKDQSAAAQVEIYDDRVSVFNTGHSLMNPDQLFEGGKSQSRNPLIARALRLAGFAEISGSGIRALQRACQIARRPVPVIKSDPKANTFTLIIDWSERGDEKDAYWHTLLGISISPAQAEVLNVIALNPSVTISAIEAQTGLDIESIASALDFLELQVLVTSDDSNYRLSDHLREQLG
jgi:hypothetical protein